MSPPVAPTRRDLLGAALGLAGCATLAGCAGPAGTGSAVSGSAGRSTPIDATTGVTPTSATTSAPTSAATPSTTSAAATSPAAATTPAPPATAATGATLPVVPTWVPSPADVRPGVKLAAVRTLEALLAHGVDGVGAEAARARVAATGQDPALVDGLGALVATSGATAVQVVDAQYGGILATSASVLVVCRTWTLVAGRVTQGGTTVDVRLTSASPRWRVTALLPSQPGAATTALSSAARAVLASPRITLPPASLADVSSGRVHDSALEAMLALARRFTLGVSVVRSGHPLLVFGTSRRSDHPQGRAFDTWQVDGQAVVAPSTPPSLVTAYMRAAAAAGSYNVGGPVLLPGPTYFSDDTHHDHVHAGFRA